MYATQELNYTAPLEGQISKLITLSHTYTKPHTITSWDCYDITFHICFMLKVMEWLYHVQNLSAVSPLYADAFRRGLMALRHDRYFKTLSVWMRFISCKPVKLQ